MFRLPRVMVPGTWRNTSTLRVITESEWSSVWWFFTSDGEFLSWYVNLEIPLGRTELGTDRIDGALDVQVDPDRRWRWKDEDEADAAVEAGRLRREQLALLRAEGERLIALAEAGAFPFDGTWCDFRPDPDWPAPRLPASVLDGLRSGAGDR
jgi:protein associated with RNAse G/E